METETGFKEHIDAMRKAVSDCNDVDELRKMQDDLRDVMIVIVAYLRENGMKTKLTRAWRDLISEF